MNSPVQPSTAVRIEILTGADRGQTVSAVTPKFLIGREPDCHLRLSGRHVSRHHCVLLPDGYAVRVRDLGSDGGTFVNSSPLRGERSLRSGDLLGIGSILLRVQFAERVPSAEPPVPVQHENAETVSPDPDVRILF